MRHVALILMLLVCAITSSEAQQWACDDAGFGEASQRNLEMMLANPEQLASPARETPRHSAQRDEAFGAHVRAAAKARREPASIRTND